jgi:hypothetical protein
MSYGSARAEAEMPRRALLWCSLFLWLDFIFADMLAHFVSIIKCEKALMAYGNDCINAKD